MNANRFNLAAVSALPALLLATAFVLPAKAHAQDFVEQPVATGPAHPGGRGWLVSRGVLRGEHVMCLAKSGQQATGNVLTLSYNIKDRYNVVVYNPEWRPDHDPGQGALPGNIYDLVLKIGDTGEWFVDLVLEGGFTPGEVAPGLLTFSVTPLQMMYITSGLDRARSKDRLSGIAFGDGMWRGIEYTDFLVKGWSTVYAAWNECVRELTIKQRQQQQTTIAAPAPQPPTVPATSTLLNDDFYTGWWSYKGNDGTFCNDVDPVDHKDGMQIMGRGEWVNGDFAYDENRPFRYLGYELDCEFLEMYHSEDGSQGTAQCFFEGTEVKGGFSISRISENLIELQLPMVDEYTLGRCGVENPYMAAKSRKVK